jgi:hypothetical protein
MQRVVVTSSMTSGECTERLYLLKLDLATGALTMDDTFRDTDGKVGFTFANREWPHGWKGSGCPTESSSRAENLNLWRWFVGNARRRKRRFVGKPDAIRERAWGRSKATSAKPIPKGDFGTVTQGCQNNSRMRREVRA